MALTKNQIIKRLYGERKGYSVEEWKTANRAIVLLEHEQKLRSEMYRLYLRSPKWRAKRKAVMTRDNGQCQFCGAKAIDVHHLTYVRIFNESIYDLVAICRSCHDLLHAMDEGR